MTSLNFLETKISTLLRSIEKLAHLKELDSSHSKVKYLPYLIRNSVNLDRLVLHDFVFESLPDSIGGLTELTIFDLSRTLDSFGSLKHLKVIDLSKSKLKYLQSYIGNHVNFEMLDLSACELESLLDSIGAVKMF